MDVEERFAPDNVLERYVDGSNVRLLQRGRQLLIPIGFFVALYPSMTSAFALLLGAVIALTFGNPYLEQTRKLTRTLLAWSIVGLGAGVNLMVVLNAGTSGIIFTFISLIATLVVGTLLGRFLNVDRETSALISVGTAICGGSAIAAVAAAIRAKDSSTSIALGIVFILNAVALFIFPNLGHWFELSEAQFGWWSALAIHDTSSVVGATLQYGPQALEVGTTVKLARALWIIPVSLLFVKFFVPTEGSTLNKSKAQYPWFIGGFLLTSALFSTIEQLQTLAFSSCHKLSNS